MVHLTLWSIALLATSARAQQTVSVPLVPVDTAPPLPDGTPEPAPAYMLDNRLNYFHSAPDKGTLDGPVLESPGHSAISPFSNTSDPLILRSSLETRANTDNYWLSISGSAGKSPLAPSGYQFYRNVRDFGATGDGKTDDTAAINRAASAFALGSTKERCGKSCGSSTTLGAVVYFPPGKYLISSPIVQYYYTQFVGNPSDMPTLIGSITFKGIAMIDNDPYIPGGNGNEWYINQSNFLRQIRNINFDLTAMPRHIFDGAQQYVPAGVHWQVGQATSITNCNFKMTGGAGATAVGIFMENGSGGTVSDLTFTGGNIGFLAGSQQFTAKNLKFSGCQTAIVQQWNWGFTWKNLLIESCKIGLNCTNYGGVPGQGTGSISLLDSHFNNVPNVILIGAKAGQQPNVVIDNVLVENSGAVVQVEGASTPLLAGSAKALTIDNWANGYQFLPNGSGGKKSGFMDPKPDRVKSLLDNNGAYYSRSKPQYAGLTPIVATQNGCANDATGDQTTAINNLLAKNVGKIIFFPAGIYMVKGTVVIPVGSIIIGSGWSQIMGTGAFFEDADHPKVMIQVGKEGDKGIIEISDMLFTVKGPTAGAILMEWNVHESTQGSAAMWDSHFRVGGAAGTNLQLADCPAHASSVNKKCMAASLMMHLTSKSSGYFDNVWAWVADHDLDDPKNAGAAEGPDGIPSDVGTNLAVYAARGILIESQGPSWFYGSASEHAQLYQYQLFNARNIFMGHMQTETPYYQPNPNALSPYKPQAFAADPTFRNCVDDSCKTAWALRVIKSRDIFIYSLGFYSFFQNNNLGCTANENCQLALIDTNYACGLWMYNIFTKGAEEIVSPEGGIAPLRFNASTRNGYTSEIAAWLALSQDTCDIGQDENGGSSYVTIDPDVWTQGPSPTVQCFPPCTYVMPPLTLPTSTTLVFPILTTTLSIGYYSSTTLTINNTPTPTSIWLVSMETTTITIPPVTTNVISWFDATVTDNSTVVYLTPSITHSPIVITDPTIIFGKTYPTGSTRTFYPPPWPGTTVPPDFLTPTTTSTSGGNTNTKSSTVPPGGTTVHHTGGPPKPTCHRILGCGHHCNPLLEACTPCWLFCGGPPGINPVDPDQPGGRSEPGQESSTSCSTSTYSTCQTTCVPSAATSSCTSTCNDVVGCKETSGSSVCSLPPVTNTWHATPGSNSFPTLGSGGTAGYVYRPGQQTPIRFTATNTAPGTGDDDGTVLPTSTKPPTTTTTSPPYPTNTAENDGPGYCYNSGNGPYVQFSEADAKTIVSNFCNRGYVLQPGNTFGFVDQLVNGYALYISAEWAKDQTGCGAEKDFPFKNDAFCRAGWSTDYFCGDESGTGDQPTSFGGGYVLKSADGGGCLLLQLYATANTGKRSPLELGGGGRVPRSSDASSINGTTVSRWSRVLTPGQPHRAQLFADEAHLLNSAVNANSTSLLV